VTSEVECDKVILNDKEIAYEATNHFIKTGSKKIALVTTENYFKVSESRRDGYLLALKDNNLKVDENFILTLPYDMENDRLIKEFFQANKIDAVLCVNEIFTIQCMSFI